MPTVQELLDQAAEAFHALCGDKASARVEQFASHLATVKMVVDLAANELSKESV